MYICFVVVTHLRTITKNITLKLDGSAYPDSLRVFLFTTMKELREYFSGKGQVKGYVFNQVLKTDYGYIYEVKGENSVHYEVFERRENTMYNCVSYPTDKAFGLWAWTCVSIGDAKYRLDQIGFRVQQRESV